MDLCQVGYNTRLHTSPDLETDHFISAPAFNITGPLHHTYLRIYHISGEEPFVRIPKEARSNHNHQSNYPFHFKPPFLFNFTLQTCPPALSGTEGKYCQ